MSKETVVRVSEEYYKIISITNHTLLPDEGLMFEKSAFESLYGGHFTLSTQLIRPSYLIYRMADFRGTQFKRKEFFNTLRSGEIVTSSFVICEIKRLLFTD